MRSFMHLCKPAHNVNFLPEQWQQIIPKLWGSEWNWPSLEQCINWVPKINVTQPAPTAVQLFHLGHLQLKTGAWSSSTKYMEKSFEKTLEVGVFLLVLWIGNETREAGREICSCERKGEFIIIILF